MNKAEYKAISRGQGAKVRAFLHGATNRTMGSRSLSQLREQLLEDGIPVEHHDKLIDAYKAVAKKARDPKADLFGLRQETDLEAVAWVRKIKAADDIFGEDGIPAGTPDREGNDRSAREVLARSRGLTGDEFAEAEADRAKAAELERLGFKRSS